MCHNTSESIAEQVHGKKTKQERKRVTFDCDSDGSTPCGGCGDERIEEQDGSENGSDDTEECRNDQNFVGDSAEKFSWK